IFLLLYPAFRRYLKDRKSAKGDEEKNWSYVRERNGRKAVDIFIDLGPTFVKLGQVLSARSDLLPKEYIRSFERLQDDVPPAPFNQAKIIIERNLGKIDDVFDSFDKDAVSGASLGQVYTAYYNEKKVAVKVNRPNVEVTLKRDIIILEKLLRFAKGRVEFFLYSGISNVLKDFRRRVFDEMDYRKEASNAERIRSNVSGREKLLVPGIITELSSKEVMVMEFVQGTKITDIKKLTEKGIDLKELAFRLDITFLRMLLRDDIFHADPHPGNLSVLDDGTLIMYDFGMVGSLDRNTRFLLMSLYDGLTRSDIDQIIDSLLSLKALSPAANRGVIRRSIEIAMSGLSGKSAEESEIRELLEIANGVVFEFPFRLPRSLVLYMRMSSLLEGICLTLDPEFKFVKVLRKLFYDEGLLNELYKGQIDEFIKKSIVSLESGLDILPLMKRKLEAEDSEIREKKDRSIPISLFSGFLFVGGIYIIEKNEFYGVIAIILSLILFGVSLRRK
ncbi:MAG: ABC1 kinase family protein, partial [Thermoplasmataceae archaeon]